MFENTVKKAADTIHRVAVATVNEYGFYTDLVDAMSDSLDSDKAYDDSNAEFIRGAETMLDFVKAYAKTKTELIREG